MSSIVQQALADQPVVVTGMAGVAVALPSRALLPLAAAAATAESVTLSISTFWGVDPFTIEDTVCCRDWWVGGARINTVRSN